MVIVGGGRAGEILAGRTAAAGLSTIIVEGELLGGECPYWACIPSKTLLRSGKALTAATRLPGAREAVTAGLDAAAVLARRDVFTSGHDDSRHADMLRRQGVGVIRGHGRLDGPARVVVATANGVEELTAAQALVLATGSSAWVPEVPGLREARPWTTREATNAKDAPRRLAVLGGGPSGLELAHAWRALGSEHVVVLVRGPSLLPDHEPFVGPLVLAGLEQADIEVRLRTSVARVQREHPDGEVVLHLGDGGVIVADELLVAAGRVPATRDLGLQTVGLRPGSVVDVDEDLRVKGIDRLYAIGDVNGRSALTHQGKYQGRVLAAGIIARSRGLQPAAVAETDDRAAQVVFTEPEVASVGWTAAEAAQRGLRVRTVTTDIGRTSGAQIHSDGYAGTGALVLDEDARVIVGATLVGQDVAELIHWATLAVVERIPLDRLRHSVPSFPTMSEVWLDLLEEVGP